MFISRSYCKLLISRMVSHSFNNCFNAPGKRCIQILYHFHMYEITFSVAGLPRLCELFLPTLLFSSLSICSKVFKSGLWTGQIFHTVTPSSAKLCCVTRDLWHGAPSCWKISLFSSQVSNFLLQVNIFGPIKVTDNVDQLSWTITFYGSQKHHTLTFKFHRSHCVTWAVSFSSGPSAKLSLIKMQLYPSFITEHHLIPSSCIP